MSIPTRLMPALEQLIVPTLLLNMDRRRIMAGYRQNSIFKSLVGA